MNFIMGQVKGTATAKMLWERGFYSVGSTRVMDLVTELPKGTKVFVRYLTNSTSSRKDTDAEEYEGCMLQLPHEEFTYYINNPAGASIMAELYALYPEEPKKEVMLGYAEYVVKSDERGMPKGVHVLDLQGNAIGGVSFVVSSSVGEEVVMAKMEQRELLPDKDSDDEWHDAHEQPSEPGLHPHED